MILHKFLTLTLLSGAVAAQGSIVGSKHDFSSASWNSGGEICRVCHTPHGKSSSLSAEKLLWNHNVSSATYTLYSSSSLKGGITQPQAASKRCLACHDGTIAVDAFDGGSGGTQYVTGDALVGTDLRATHPISVKWVHKKPYGSCSNCHDQHTSQLIDGPLPFPGGRVECTTCHEPHGKTPANPSGTHMLRVTMNLSQLCLRCHGM